MLAVWALFIAIIWGSPAVGTSTVPSYTASSTPTGMVIKTSHATITVVMDDATTTPATTTPEVVLPSNNPNASFMEVAPGPAGTPVTQEAPAVEAPKGYGSVPVMSNYDMGHN